MIRVATPMKIFFILLFVSVSAGAQNAPDSSSYITISGNPLTIEVIGDNISVKDFDIPYILRLVDSIHKKEYKEQQIEYDKTIAICRKKNDDLARELNLKQKK